MMNYGQSHFESVNAGNEPNISRYYQENAEAVTRSYGRKASFVNCNARRINGLAAKKKIR